MTISFCLREEMVVVRAYRECAEWAEDRKVSAEAAYVEVTDFRSARVKANPLPGACTACLYEERLGHDLWLSRHGHGAGFFDREEVYGPWANHLQRLRRWGSSLLTQRKTGIGMQSYPRHARFAKRASRYPPEWGEPVGVL